MPDTFQEFISDWNKKFPLHFDTKLLATNSKVFFKTSLGEVYEKCTSDGKFKENIKCAFDVKNGFVNYDGTGLLSHYHEAAYDAHMTGVAFMHILKFKEIEYLKNLQRAKAKKGKQQKKGEETKDPGQSPDDVKN